MASETMLYSIFSPQAVGKAFSPVTHAETCGHKKKPGSSGMNVFFACICEGFAYVCVHTWVLHPAQHLKSQRWAAEVVLVLSGGLNGAIKG